MASSNRRLRQAQLAVASVGSFILAAASVHCGTSEGEDGSSGNTGANGSGGSGSGASGQGGELGIDVPGAKDHSQERLIGDDPFPMGCDGGGNPPSIGGTPECPDDKNIEGCPCNTQGETAACWPGKRKNRHHGICKDGETTCTLDGETNLVWGPCNGAVLPKDNPTNAKEACLCFSGGHWQIDNTSPCFFFNDATQTDVFATVSTLPGPPPACPADANSAPAQAWSANRITVDCTGFFKLCYSLKAGNGRAPQPTDCEVVKVCTEAYYPTANVEFEMPPLPSWLANSPASVTCAEQFVASGGYGEMSVVGESDECDKVDKSFNWITYCPLSCNGPNPPPECANCVAGGGGDF